MAYIDWSAAIGGFLGGSTGIVAAAVTQWITGNRERRDRKNDFRGFLGEWHQDIIRVPENNQPGTYDAYMKKVHHLSGYSARLSRDFPFRRSRFKNMCAELGTLEPKHFLATTGDCRCVVANKIQALIDFV
jgi:hypothetical protein